MIKKLKITNFKGKTEEIKLSQFNLFRGPSGSGKSTWLEAACVGILGYHPNQGKAAAATMQNLASGDFLGVQMQLSDVLVERSFARDKGGRCSQLVQLNDAILKQRDHDQLIPYLGEFPVMLDLGEFLNISDDKKADFLFSHSDLGLSVEGVTRISVLEVLKSHTDAVPYIQEFQFKKQDPAKMNPATWKKFLKAILDKAEEQEASSALHPMLANVFMEEHGPSDSGQQALALYLQVVRDEINLARRETTECEKAIASLVEQKHTVELPAGSAKDISKRIKAIDGEILELTTDIKSAQKLSEGAQAQVDAIAESEKLIATKEEKLLGPEPKIDPGFMEELDGHNEDAYKMMDEGLEAATKKLNDGPLKKVDEAKQFMESAAADVRMFKVLKAAKQESGCPHCGLQVPLLLPGSLNDYTASYVKYKEAHYKATEEWKVARAEVDKMNQEILEFKKRGEGIVVLMENVKKEVAQYKEDKKELEGMKKALVKQKEAYKAPEATGDMEEMEKRKSALEIEGRELSEELTSFERIRVLDISITESSEKMVSLGEMLGCLKKAAVVIKALRNQLMNELTSPLEATANVLLTEIHPTMRLVYDVGDKFSTLCTNLHGEPVNYSALSGGEKVIYACAQLVALIHLADPPLKLLQGELGELSGERVPELMAGISKVAGDNIQIMLASCHSDFEPYAGWEVMHYG